VSYSLGAWANGLTEWTDGDTAYLSIAFTWKLDEAYRRAQWFKAMGMRVVAGGPALFQPKLRRHHLHEIAEIPTKIAIIDGKPKEIGADAPGGEAVQRHNPMATYASRGCPVGCSFCIVPWMEGKTFTLLPDFPVRPVLCDNNLSALDARYQDHIVGRYQAEGVPLLDANSGFEPRTFDEEVLARWTPINRGPWRFAYDDAADGQHVARVMRMLDKVGVSARRRQVYTLIGNEPFEACMDRIRQVIAWGGEPYAQPFMKLNALVYRPHVRFDWTEHRLRQVQRWVNAPAKIWRKVPFDQYDASIKTIDAPDARQMEFVK